MTHTTYAIYGQPITDERDYIGTVDTPEAAQRLAERWLEDYRQTVISADTLTDDGTWKSTEHTLTQQEATPMSHPSIARHPTPPTTPITNTYAVTVRFEGTATYVVTAPTADIAKRSALACSRLDHPDLNNHIITRQTISTHPIAGYRRATPEDELDERP